MTTFKIDPKDIERGKVLAPLTYRQGNPPDGFPQGIDLRVPTHTEAFEGIAKFLATNDPYIFLSLVMPPHCLKPGFIEKLAPLCVADLIEASYVLSLGLDVAAKIFPLRTPPAPNRN